MAAGLPEGALWQVVSFVFSLTSILPSLLFFLYSLRPSFLPSCGAGGGLQVLSNTRPCTTNEQHSSPGILRQDLAKAGFKFMTVSTSSAGLQVLITMPAAHL